MAITDESVELAISLSDQEDIQDLYRKIRAAQAKLVGPDGKSQVLPPNLYAFLCQVLGDLKSGKSITILQSNVELTTVEAAKVLSVSRQFLVSLLKSREIPYHMTGTHRRVYARDILEYKARRDFLRRHTLDELSRSEIEAGRYIVNSRDDSHS